MAAPTKTLTRTLFGAAGSLFLFACAGPSCGSASAHGSDAAADAAPTDAGRRDAGRLDPQTDSALPESKCVENLEGWTALPPFNPTCQLLLARAAEVQAIAPPLVPCNNGQPQCRELALPNEPNTSRPNFASFVVEPEGDTFLLSYSNSASSTLCRRTLRISPANTEVVRGALQRDYLGCANLSPAGADLALNRSLSNTDGGEPRVALLSWDTAALSLNLQTRAEFGSSLPSQSTLYTFEPSQGVYDIIDIPSKTLTKTISPPTTIRQFYPYFAVAGDLWGTAVYGQLGKGEAWRLDGTGVWSPMIQKAGVHIFAPRSDGQTLFWVEGSGNEADLYPQPKLEIWAAPLTKSPATLNATKRKLVDISGYGYAVEGAAHGGFFGINLGVSDLIVVRGSDGASQRIHLEGGWGAPSVAYVDATQIWFGHGASPASGTSFARIALDPWP